MRSRISSSGAAGRSLPARRSAPRPRSARSFVRGALHLGELCRSLSRRPHRHTTRRETMKTPRTRTGRETDTEPLSIAELSEHCAASRAPPLLRAARLRRPGRRLDRRPGAFRRLRSQRSASDNRPAHRAHRHADCRTPARGLQARHPQLRCRHHRRAQPPLSRPVAISAGHRDHATTPPDGLHRGYRDPRLVVVSAEGYVSMAMEHYWLETS